MAELQPGPELDRLLCEAAGIPPTGQATHDFRDPDGNGLDECDCGATFGNVPRGEACPKGRMYYLPVSRDGNAVLRLIEAMGEKQWKLSIIRQWNSYDVVYRFIFNETDDAAAACNHSTLPGAVALAAAAALGVKA